MWNRPGKIGARLAIQRRGQYVESVIKKKEKRKKVCIYIIADEQPSTLGYQISNKSWVT
jgi:hypothetical protein